MRQITDQQVDIIDTGHALTETRRELDLKKQLAEKAGRKALCLEYYNRALSAAGVIGKLPPAADIAGAKAGIAGLLGETARVRAARGAYELADYYNLKRERFIKWR